MEKLKAIRGGHRSAVTRLINRTKERISQDDIGHEELSAAADNLTKKRNLLESLDSQILDGTELEDMEQEILDADDYAMNMEVAIRRFKDIVSGNKTTPFQQTVHSEAAQCISGLSLSNANYEHAIILLKERYGQTQTIINAYMQNLLELTHPSLTPQSIRVFYDKMESCIRGLESLGQSQDTFGSLLVPIIFGKLPDEMKKLMTREHGKRNWDIRSLREAIGKEDVRTGNW
ncbi:Hypothetical predicted protein [Mytilus galloprovincialis]|uniref:Uncharacterized protein n=1 Tax=Mytilus galloprovincialis TaxID=29158 RepID=A0A8B6EQY3_MYTGA|nr:Hypothetical predicted protein [Mytilus galloprovincialis]